MAALQKVAAVGGYQSIAVSLGGPGPARPQGDVDDESVSPVEELVNGGVREDGVHSHRCAEAEPLSGKQSLTAAAATTMYENGPAREIEVATDLA